MTRSPSLPPTELSKGEIIRRGRLLRGLTQLELARRSGVHAGSIWQYEKGERIPRQRTMERLLAALEIPLASAGSLAALDHVVDWLPDQAPPKCPPLAEAPGDLARLQKEIAAELERTVDLAFFEVHLLQQGERSAAEPVPALWRKLTSCEPRRRARLVQGDPAYWNPGLCLWLCDESEAGAAADAEEARGLAKLARTVAQKLRHTEPANRYFVRLEGHAEALVANAFRVAGDHGQAEAAFARAWEIWAQGEDEAGSLSEARLLHLHASLRRDQRRFAEALELHRRALAAARPGEVGTILLKQSATLEAMGDYDGALAALAEAAPHIDGQLQPRLAFGLRFNQTACLCRLGRAREARPLVFEVRQLAEQLGHDLDLVRTLALEALVDAGLGKIDAAIESLEEVCCEFERRGYVYDFALEALDLALLYRQQSRWRDIHELADRMVGIFRERNIHRETIAAVILFQEAAEREAVTEEVVRRLREDLKAAQAQPG